jgi:cysteine desulfurase
VKIIYLDNNATTPVDPRVKLAMDPYLADDFGNASSQSHAFGWKAQMAVDKARSNVAKLFAVPSKAVVFTSGATESNNLAILGTLDFLLESEKNPHFLTTATEHKAVLQVFELAKKRGAEVSICPVDALGVVDLIALKNLIKPNTRFLSVMAANNEIGTLNPIAKIADLCAEKKIIFHCDAAQAVGRIPLDLGTLKIDLLSLSGHKIYGPKGVGALIVRPINRPFEVRPIIVGGEQENCLRPGTLNVPGIVGLGKACELAQAEMDAEIKKLNSWCRQILSATLSVNGAILNGHPKERLCNNLSFSFEHFMPDQLMTALSGLAYSSGSACTSGNPTPSHVLKAIGRSDKLARSTVRFGLGRFTTADEVAEVIAKISRLNEPILEAQ